MANPFYNGQEGGMSFPQFMHQMRGKNPNEIINNMVNSGKITQQQLNDVQKRANEMMSAFDGFRSMFGF